MQWGMVAADAVVLNFDQTQYIFQCVVLDAFLIRKQKKIKLLSMLIKAISLILRLAVGSLCEHELTIY